MVIGYPVDIAAARAWLAGADDDPDLLDAATDQSPIAYIARMRRRRDWPVLHDLLAILQAQALCFRTRCPGLLRLALAIGGTVTWREPDGAARVFVPRPAIETGLQRLRDIYGFKRKIQYC